MHHLRLIWLPLTKKFKKSRLNTVFHIFLLQNRKALPPQENNYLKSKNHVPCFINTVSMVLTTTSGASSKRPTVTHKKRDKQHCYTQWHGTCAFYICVCVYVHIYTYIQTGIYLYIFLLVWFTMKSQHPCIFLMVHLRNLLSHSQVFQGSC